MPDFDPYLKWLGIREAQRPVNHYRLLGLELYESDPDVISSAADRQMAHIRTYQNGARAELSQQILNELAVARRCLLMPEQKEAYDQQIKQEMAGRENQAAEPEPETKQPTAPAFPDVRETKKASPPSAPVVAAQGAVRVKADASHRQKRQSQERKQLTLSIIGWIGGGVAAVIVSGILIYTGVIPGFNNKPTVDPDPDQVAKAGSTDTDTSSQTTTNKKPENNTNNNRPNQQNPKPDTPTPKDPNNNQTPNSNQTTQTPTNPPDNQTGTATNPKTPVITDINDPKYVWDQFSLRKYPLAGADAKRLINTITTSVMQKQTHKLTVSGPGGGNADYELSFQDGLLIGLAISPYRDGRIRTIAPITLHENKVSIGREYGRQYNAKTFLVARPGYAVGEVEVSSQHPMRCIRLVYMKIRADRLDPGDRYTSQWFPRGQARPLTRIRNATGMPIVGTYGRYNRGSDIASIGLTAAKTSRVHGLVADTTPPNTTDPNTNSNSENPAATTANVKLDAPSKSQVAQARKELLELYADQVRATQSARSTRQVRDFAELLINESRDITDKPAILYAMLGEATNVSVRIGDLDTAMDAIRELDKRFVIDTWDLTKTAVDNSAKNVSSANAFLFKQSLDDLIEETIESREFKQAKWLVDRALTIVRNSSDRKAIDKYKQQERFVSELTRIDAANTRSLKTLEDEPDNAEAHEQVGTFQWAIAGNLELALKHWAKSNDQRLLAIVKHESDVDMENSDQVVALAEAWEDLGNANRTARDKRVLERALELYRTAQGLAKGVERRQIENKRKALADKLNN